MWSHHLSPARINALCYRVTLNSDTPPADGKSWQEALHAVAETSKVLGGCIEARDALDLAKGKLLRAREGLDTATLNSSSNRNRNSGGGSTGGNSSSIKSGGGGASSGGGDGARGGSRRAGVEGEDARRDEVAAAVAAAMVAAAPLSREFADKMAELSSIAPELSGLLADLTAVRVDVPHGRR